ncbi:hypothetical protein [Amycolatopsis sp. WAC 04197]|uniref:hypothetical protein n=1 Tax=Amycolatopsis sp. WAC 04197 TaxID=2203199 RepID=UPI000F781280|nr:hypothetical protein [Amycolatopsis sp. WAC 04197]
MLAGPAAVSAAGPRREDARPCAHDARFQVATANNANAAKGVLLFLSRRSGAFHPEPGVGVAGRKAVAEFLAEA